jgi:putative peptide zinc metalloprotease protein
MEEERQTPIFPPEAARLDAIFVQEGDQVSVGDRLFRFSVPDLPVKIGQSETRAAMHNARLLSAAGDAIERAEGTVIARMIEEESETLAALKDRQDRLLVMAAMDGEVRELSPDLDVGTWYKRTHLMGRIIQPGPLVIRGFVSEADLQRLDLSREAEFVADEPQIPILPLQDIQVSDFAIDRLPDGYLARPNGGLIAVSSSDPDALAVAGVWYPVNAQMNITERPNWLTDDRAMRGQVVMRSNPQSYAHRVGKRVAQVLIRELEF